MITSIVAKMSTEQATRDTFVRLLGEAGKLGWQVIGTMPEPVQKDGQFVMACWVTPIERKDKK